MITNQIEIVFASPSAVIAKHDGKSVTIDWPTLRAAARQDDETLRVAYAAALDAAERKMLTNLREEANRRVAACSGHHAAKSKDRGFYGPVSRENENPMAHGNICVHETCSCGAERRRNVNGRHEEIGAWMHPAIQDVRALVKG